MALATPDLLAPVGADLLPTASGLDRLAVDATDAGRERSAGGLAEPDSKEVEDTVPGAIALPGVEVVIDGPPRGEIVGQRPPGAALVGDVEESVEDLAHVGLARSAAGPGPRDLGLQHGPLGVDDVRRIGLAFHIPLYATHPFWNRL